MNPTPPNKSARTALRYIGRMLRAKGWSKHGRAGLQRRKEMRSDRRSLLEMTFSRTLMKRLNNVSGT